MAELPDMLDVVARARELDAFAGEHDAQLALHLRARRRGLVGRLHPAAAPARHGFVAGARARAHGAARAPRRARRRCWCSASTPRRRSPTTRTWPRCATCTLSFDVAQTDPAPQPFAAWQSAARPLAADMDATIVDDQGRPLSDARLRRIGAELERLYARARDARPGGRLAGGAAAVQLSRAPALRAPAVPRPGDRVHRPGRV